MMYRFYVFENFMNEDMSKVFPSDIAKDIEEIKKLLTSDLGKIDFNTIGKILRRIDRKLVKLRKADKGRDWEKVDEIFTQIVLRVGMLEMLKYIIFRG